MYIVLSYGNIIYIIYIYIYIYIYDNKVIQVEGEIYWEIKLTLWCFGSTEPSSGLWGVVLVMLS